MPKYLTNLTTFEIPLRPYNITGLENVRAFLKEDNIKYSDEKLNINEIPKLKTVIEDLYNSR